MTVALNFEPKSGTPLYRTLYEALLEAIESGQLPPGAAIPSTRELSGSYKISRVTVLRAYEMLLSQGLIKSLRGSGTFVSEKSVAAQGHRKNSETFDSPPAKLSQFGQRLVAPVELSDPANEAAPTHEQVDVTIQDLPIATWKGLIMSSLKEIELSPLNSIESRESELLCKAIAKYLLRARAVRCDHSQVFVFANKRSAIDVCLRSLVDHGDCIAVEDSCLPEIDELAAAHGLNALVAPSDEHGMLVNGLFSNYQKPKIVYLSPQGQNTSGLALLGDRRTHLLEEADMHDSYIIEDDEDSEYFYIRRPLPSIQGQDQEHRVIYVSTLGKALAPVSNVACVVVPKTLVSTFRRAQSLAAPSLSLVELKALSKFISNGTMERHIFRTRVKYSRRRRAIVYSLTNGLKTSIYIARECAARHLIVQFARTIPDEIIQIAAVESGLTIKRTATSMHMAQAGPYRYFVVFSSLEVNQLQARAETLTDSINKYMSMLETQSHFSAAPTTEQDCIALTSEIDLNVEI